MNLYIDDEWYRRGATFLHSYATNTFPCYQIWDSKPLKENVAKPLLYNMNLYIDNERYPGGKVFLHSYATDESRCFQLWGSMLTAENIAQSLQLAANG
jgi:hypothetical protein